jgi:hypothetical protein
VSDPIVIVSKLKNEGEHGRSIYVPDFPEAQEGFYLVVGAFESEEAVSDAAKKVVSTFGLDVMALRYGTPDSYGASD